jgi:hypothetical protein
MRHAWTPRARTGARHGTNPSTEATMSTTFRQAALAAALLAATATTAGAAAAQRDMHVTFAYTSAGGAAAVPANGGGTVTVAATPKETVIAAVNQYFPHLPAHLEQPLTFVVGADGKVIRAERGPQGVNATLNPSTIQLMEVFKGASGGITVDGRYVDVIWITLK